MKFPVHPGMRTDSAGPSGQTRFSMDPQQSVISASVSSGVHLQDNTGTIPNKYVPEGRQLQTSQPQSSVHRGRSLSIAQVVPTPRSRAGNINDTCNVNDDTMDSINGNSDRDSTIFEEGEGYDDSAAGGFQSRNKTNYQSFRLDSNSFAPGTLHRGSVVHVIPNQRRYTSFRLRRSKCIVCACVCIKINSIAHDPPQFLLSCYAGLDQVMLIIHGKLRLKHYYRGYR